MKKSLAISEWIVVKIFAALISVELAACSYEASFSDCRVVCSAASGCPGGLECSFTTSRPEGLCRPAGASLSCSSVLADAGTPATKVDFPTGAGPQSVVIGDFNGDGKPDLVVSNSLSATISVFINKTATGATSPSFATKVDFPTGAAPIGVAIGDLNGDGKPDVAVADYSSNTVSVLLNTTATGATTPSFAPKVDFPTGLGPIRFAIGDLNGDGKLDLAVGNTGSATISVLLNTTTTQSATPSFAVKVDFPTGAGPASVAIGDLNGNGKPDLAVANSFSSNSVSILLNTTTAGATTPSFVAMVDFPAAVQPTSVAIGDLNGDGKPDLAVAGGMATTVSVLLNTTTTGAMTPSFAAKVDFTTGAFPDTMGRLPDGAAIGDFDGDGKPDLVGANTGGVSVLVNTTGTGATMPTFATQVDYTTGSTPGSVAIGDLNSDSNLDLAVTNDQVATVSVLLFE